MPDSGTSQTERSEVPNSVPDAVRDAVPDSVRDAAPGDSPRTDQRVPQPDLWLQEHGDVLYKFAHLRVNDAHIAEDLVQETLLKAMAGFANFRQESSIRTWLFAILRNEIHRHGRTNKNRDRLISGGDGSESLLLDRLLHPGLASAQFATAVEREEFWEVIQQCYEQLPEHLLDTFLYRLANPSERIDQLCCELGIKRSNLSVRLFRARLMLRHCVERKWINGG